MNKLTRWVCKVTQSHSPLLIFLFIVSIVPSIFLFHGGFPITHDGQDHVARIANFYASLSEGNIFPRWAANLNWGFGHPILMFLYPLSSYIASFFHALGFSYADSVILVFSFAFSASIFTMYIWIHAGWGKKAGLIAAVLYGFAPYRFVDMTIRGAIGEHVAFIFPPLVCYFMLRLAWACVSCKKTDSLGIISSDRIRYGTGLSVSLGLFILSHNAISIMFLPVFALYALYLFYFESKKSAVYIFWLFLAVIGGFGMSAFFWIPALFEGKYTLREIVTKGETITRFVPWSWFFWSPWQFGQGNEITKEVGFIQWITIAFSSFVAIRMPNGRNKIFLFGATIVFFISLIIMTDVSAPIWNAVSVLKKFQFPWRFLSLSVFCAAVIAGVGISRHMTDYVSKVRLAIYIIVLCFITVGITVQMWFPKGYNNKHESFFSGIYESTTDTGESAPIWSVRFMEKRADALAEVIDGDAIIVNKKRKINYHEYLVSAKMESRIVENTLYFPGWSVLVDSQSVEIQFQDPSYRGLMTFIIPEGEHHVVVQFGTTKVRIVAEIISVGTILILTICCVGGIWIFKNKKTICL